MRDPGVDPASIQMPGLNQLGSVARAGATTATNDDTAAASGALSASGQARCERALTLWRAVDLDLSPIIGRRGTGALLRRALFVTRSAHDWLPDPHDDVGFDACLDLLGQALAGREAIEADAASRALESTFRDLLSSLVGGALTAQLLRTAWAHHGAGDAR